MAPVPTGRIVLLAILVSGMFACTALPVPVPESAGTPAKRAVPDEVAAAPPGASLPPRTMPPAVPLPESGEVSVSELAVHHAMTMLGRRYRARGADPRTGFDASGLIYYSFRKAGADIPRSHLRQRESSGRVMVAQLRLADLVYFDMEGQKNAHVGLYIGDGRFVHASAAERRVGMERIDTPYWARRLSEARRLDARRSAAPQAPSSLLEEH